MLGREACGGGDQYSCVLTNAGSVTGAGRQAVIQAYRQERHTHRQGLVTGTAQCNHRPHIEIYICVPVSTHHEVGLHLLSQCACVCGRFNSI